MLDYVELLGNIVIVPEITYNAEKREKWDKFEKEIGIIFPNDYKKIISRYGTGGLGNFIWFLTPFVSDNNVNYTKKMREMLEAYKVSKSNFPDYFKHNIYPEEDGLLPWGYTENGDELYWKTSSSPDNWEIVIYESASPEYYSYKMSLAEFLYKIIIKQLECSILSDNLSDGKLKYIAVDVI